VHNSVSVHTLEWHCFPFLVQDSITPGGSKQSESSVVPPSHSMCLFFTVLSRHSGNCTIPNNSIPWSSIAFIHHPAESLFPRWGGRWTG
jgi:hypothetical protein